MNNIEYIFSVYPNKEYVNVSIDYNIYDENGHLQINLGNLAWFMLPKEEIKKLINRLQQQV